MQQTSAPGVYPDSCLPASSSPGLPAEDPPAPRPQNVPAYLRLHTSGQRRLPRRRVSIASHESCCSRVPRSPVLAIPGGYLMAVCVLLIMKLYLRPTPLAPWPATCMHTQPLPVACLCCSIAYLCCSVARLCCSCLVRSPRHAGQNADFLYTTGVPAASLADQPVRSTLLKGCPAAPLRRCSPGCPRHLPDRNEPRISPLRLHRPRTPPSAPNPESPESPAGSILALVPLLRTCLCNNAPLPTKLCPLPSAHAPCPARLQDPHFPAQMRHGCSYLWGLTLCMACF